jgi:tetratricopeptide (TPR) repeat protein
VSQLKQYRQAIRDYDKVLGLDPENVSAYADRGLAKMEVGQFLSATVDLGDAIRRKKDDDHLLTNSHEYRGEGIRKLSKHDIAPMRAAAGPMWITGPCEQPGVHESIEVVKGLAPDLDAEAVKSTPAMPIWARAKNRKPVAVKVNIQGNFRLCCGLF